MPFGASRTPGLNYMQFQDIHSTYLLCSVHYSSACANEGSLCGPPVVWLSKMSVARNIRSGLSYEVEYQGGLELCGGEEKK